MLYTCYIRIISKPDVEQIRIKCELNVHQYRCIFSDKIIPDGIVAVGSQ